MILFVTYMEKPRTGVEDNVAFFLDMYKIPGQEGLTEHTFKRYIHDKKKQLEAKKNNEDYQNKIDRSSELEQIAIISTGLSCEESNIQEICAQNIHRISVEKITPIIQLGLRSKNLKVQMICSNLISKVNNEEEKIKLIKFGINNGNIDGQKYSVNFTLIQSLSLENRKQIIQLGLESKNPLVQIECSRAIKSIPISDRNELYNYLLELIRSLIYDNQNTENTRLASHLINNLNIEDKAQIISILEKIIDSNDIISIFNIRMTLEYFKSPIQDYKIISAKISSLISYKFEEGTHTEQINCAKMIELVSSSDRGELIIKGLNCSNLDVHKYCVQKVYDLPDTILMNIIRDSFLNNEYEKQINYAQILTVIYENKRQLFIWMVWKGLDSLNPEVQQAYIKVIPYLDFRTQKKMEKKVTKLVSGGLKNTDPKIQRLYIPLIVQLPDNIKQEFFRLAQQNANTVLVEPPLYDGDVSDKIISRTEFNKTGSKTIVLGGQLKNKTIMRRISSESFEAWQKIYEDCNFWYENGFDYIPIEQIQSFKYRQDNTVDVFCGVLDLSLVRWEGMTTDFNSELENDMSKIISLINKYGVDHGHPHKGNFCLRFFRNQDGTVDYSRKPRIYMIDFDQSISN